MAWCWTSDKPLSKPMVTQFRVHICGFRGRWDIRPCYNLVLLHINDTSIYCIQSDTFKGRTWMLLSSHSRPQLNILGLEHTGYYFGDDIYKCIFLNENSYVLIKISVTFVHGSPMTSSQHWFRYDLAITRWQATWINVDWDAWCHMESPGHFQLPSRQTMAVTCEQFGKIGPIPTRAHYIMWLHLYKLIYESLLFQVWVPQREPRQLRMSSVISSPHPCHRVALHNKM